MTIRECWEKWVAHRDPRNWNFRRFFKCVFCGEDPEPPQPEYVVVKVCNTSGLLPVDSCPSTFEKTFEKGSEPTSFCSHHFMTVCSETEKFPNYGCPIKTSALLDDPEEKCSIHVMPVCANPYHLTGKLAVVSAAVLTDISFKDGRYWKEADYPKYLDALVRDKINAVRGVCFGTDGTPDWDYWSFVQDGWSAYLEHIKRRLAWIKERKLTAIFTLTPYSEGHDVFLSDDDVRRLIRETKEFRPFIIYETENEPYQNENQERIVRILHEEGIENKFIQLGHHDSSDFTALHQSMSSEGLACCHNCGTMDTVNGPHPIGWANSSGTMTAMGYGMYGSNDGEDAAKRAEGVYFFEGNPASRRPSNAQLYEVAKWMSEHGHGFENLSAAGFRDKKIPDMAQFIFEGSEERLALSRGIFG